MIKHDADTAVASNLIKIILVQSVFETLMSTWQEEGGRMIKGWREVGWEGKREGICGGGRIAKDKVRVGAAEGSL